MGEHNLAFSPELYSRILVQKVLFNFNHKKRFLVAKDIVSRYLVPLHQVILLFSFVFPEAYFQQLIKAFEIKDSQAGAVKRLKIFQYLVS